MLADFANAAALWFMRRRGWRFEGQRPDFRKYVVIGAPHTSNWDFPLTMALMAHYRVPLRYMVKHSVFWWPLGPFITSLGAVPIDRGNTRNRVENTIATIKREEEIAIGILPEGTRKRVEHWRSGFYHIAHGAGVPIVPVRIDAPEQLLTMGPALMPTGDVDADMARLAEFYEGAVGIWPEGTSPVVLKKRDQAARS